MKYFSAIILFAVCQTAMADWVLIGKAEHGKLYSSREAAVRKGERVKLMELTEFNAPIPINGEQALSSTAQVEYECADMKSRTLYLYYHSGHMGGGSVVGRSTIHREWDSIPPDTLDWAKMQHACNG